MKRKKNSTDLVINSMDPDQVRHFIGPNPGSNHLPFIIITSASKEKSHKKMKGPNCVPKAHSSTFLKFKIPKILNIRNSDLKTFKLIVGQRI